MKTLSFVPPIYVYIHAGFYTGFFLGGGGGGGGGEGSVHVAAAIYSMYVCKHALSREVWGHAPHTPTHF